MFARTHFWKTKFDKLASAIDRDIIISFEISFFADRDRHEVRLIQEHNVVTLAMMDLGLRAAPVFMDHNTHFVRAFIAMLNIKTKKAILCLAEPIYVCRFARGKWISFQYIFPLNKVKLHNGYQSFQKTKSAQ